MSTMTEVSPERRVADIWMRNKGLADAVPSEVRRTEPNVWEFTYDLPDGTLVLEVAWFRDRDGVGKWDAQTVDFSR